MSLAHLMRVTVRCHVGHFRREADVSLPVSSCLDEVLEDVTGLIGAPTITRPWQASTASGTNIDKTVPLEETGIGDGAVIILTPLTAVEAPVVRDSAEALVDAGTNGITRGMVSTWAVVALTLAVFLGASFMPLWVAATCALLGGILVATVARPLAGLAPWIICTAAGAGWAAVSGWNLSPVHPGGGLIHQLLAAALPGSVVELQLGLAAACGCALIATLVCHVLRLCGPTTVAASTTVVVLAAAGALGLGLPGPGLSPAPATAGSACVVALAVILIALAPGLTTRLAGLKVPLLPTAGQDLDVADAPQPDVDVRAARAHRLYEGICIGLAMGLAPALAALALTGTGFSQLYQGLFGVDLNGHGFAFALLLCLAAAVILHAVRHGQPLAAWSLMVIAMGASSAAVAATALAGSSFTPGNAHTAMVVVSAVVLGASASSPVWARHIPELEPTTVVWLERTEALAIAACLPLAAHMAGLFMLLRGLG